MNKIYNTMELDNIASRIYFYEKNMKRAIMIWNDLMKKGSPYAKEFIGLSYYLGFYKRKNIKKAVKIFKELYEKNLSYISLNFLGECYYCGIGVKQDYAKAKKVFDKEIKIFNDITESYLTNPKFYLGEMYLFGNGVEKDYSKAKKLFDEVMEMEKLYASYIYPFKLYYYLGNLKKMEDNSDNKNNEYFNYIEAQMLDYIRNQNIETNTIEKLYETVNKYSYKKFMKNQRIKEIREFEKRIGYLSESEFTEMMDILKIKIEKRLKDDKFCKMFSIYFEYYSNWFFKIILESYNYKDIKDYINSLIEQNDYETLNIMEKMYSDGIVVDKDEKKENEYKKKIEELDDKEWGNLMKKIDTGINDLEKGINEN